jgi:F420-non-reducing hydrogenase subunit D
MYGRRLPLSYRKSPGPKKGEFTKKILDEIGIGGERLEMYNMSAAQGPRFVEIAKEMTERIKKLGPNPIKRVASAALEYSATPEKKECVV